jgi:Uncharacterized protein involved in chromosome partitioning
VAELELELEFQAAAADGSTEAEAQRAAESQRRFAELEEQNAALREQQAGSVPAAEAEGRAEQLAAQLAAKEEELELALSFASEGGGQAEEGAVGQDEHEQVVAALEAERAATEAASAAQEQAESQLQAAQARTAELTLQLEATAAAAEAATAAAAAATAAVATDPPDGAAEAEAEAPLEVAREFLLMVVPNEHQAHNKKLKLSAKSLSELAASVGDSLGLSHRLLLSAPSEPAETKPFERLEDISSKAKVRRTADKPPHRKCLPCRSAVLGV